MLVTLTHKQDEWDKFLFSLYISDRSIFKLDKHFLKKSPVTHPFAGPNDLIFLAKDRAKFFADTTNVNLRLIKVKTSQ